MDWANQYAVLRPLDRENPVAALMQVCTITYLFNARDSMHEFYRAALQSEAWEEDDPRRKSDRLFFHDTTIELYEIVYRIREMIKSGELVFTYVRPNADQQKIFLAQSYAIEPWETELRLRDKENLKKPSDEK